MWQSLKYIWTLVICQSLAASSLTQMIFSISIVGKALGGETWATLPIALMPIGTALGIFPMTQLMSFFGRRVVLVYALLLLAVANLVTAYGIYIQSFLVICFGGFLLGISIAAISQLRFAAMELVPNKLKAGAVSAVLLGGILSAFIGPELGFRASELYGQTFVGSYLAMACVALLAIPFLYRVENIRIKKEVAKKSRSVLGLLKQHSFLTAVSSAAVAYGVMSFVMTATPISMHEHFSHSLSDTKWVIQSHITAMFLPSLFSAWIVQRFGIPAMMWAGLAVFMVALLLAFVGQGLMNFWFALVMLGLGWNLLFVAGTVLLPSTHSEQEKFTAQGFNDSVVFTVQAFVALSSGLLLSLLGWQWMLLCCVPLIVWHGILLLKQPKS